MRYSKHYGTRKTSQRQAIPGTAQIENSAGGFVWKLDDWKRLDRFLVLGCEGGSYYTFERALTVESADACMRCVKSDGVRAVRRIVEISESGRAPKNGPALFLLAMAAGAGDAATRKSALEALPRVARTSTHLFEFVEASKAFRGRGRGLRRALQNWYNSRDPEYLAYQLCKYQRRGDWSHRDILRLAHPSPPTAAHSALYRWATGCDMAARSIERTSGAGKHVSSYAPVDEAQLPQTVQAFIRLQAAESEADAVRLLSGSRLSWEMIPTKFAGSARVWGALLPSLPMTALLRNLGRMGANGLLDDKASAGLVCKRLTDDEALLKARVHPVSVLSALITYRNGTGARGKLTWKPKAKIVDALDAAFYVSFKSVPVTNKRWMLALDVSGSMAGGEIAGVPGLSPRVGSAAMALVTARSEPNYDIVGFQDQITPLTITPRQRLDDVVRVVEDLSFGATDCAAPMLYAMEHGLDVDAFVVYTDNETWCGDVHPSQALRKYRDKTGIPARLIVVGMVSNGFSIADPDDAGMLDVVGFDAAVPGLISDFVSA